MDSCHLLDPDPISSVADPHFDAELDVNPDPTFHFDADPDPTFTLMLIRIRILAFK